MDFTSSNPPHSCSSSSFTPAGEHLQGVFSSRRSSIAASSFSVVLEEHEEQQQQQVLASKVG
jgi:hypothetical protein